MESDQSPSAALEEGSEYTLSDIANAFGMSLTALGHYVDRRLLGSHRNVMNRAFDDADLARLEVILRCNRLGLSQDEIQAFMTSQEGVSRSAGVERVTRMARETFGSDEKARRWLRRPTAALADLSPMDALSAGDTGLHDVVDLLKRIDHGLSV